MENNIINIKIGRIGDEKCTHLWVYKLYSNNRICEKCGRTELVIYKTYENIKAKFLKKEGFK